MALNPADKLMAEAFKNPPGNLGAWLDMMAQVRAAVQVALEEIDTAQEIRTAASKRSQAAAEREARKRGDT